MGARFQIIESSQILKYFQIFQKTKGSRIQKSSRNFKNIINLRKVHEFEKSSWIEKVHEIQYSSRKLKKVRQFS